MAQETHALDNWRTPKEVSRENPIFPNRPLKFKTWGGCQWTTVSGAEYRTDEIGEGLFELQEGDTWRQLLGTSQFSLPQDRQRALQELKREGLLPRKE